MTVRAPEDTAFVGRGWGFPVTVNSTGGIRTVGGLTEIAQAVMLILSTTPGERPLRPDFGCSLVDYVFAPMEASTFSDIASEVSRSVRRWEPRIDVQRVDVGPDPEREGCLLISLDYVIKRTYDRRNLVFPFYVIPEHAE